jgi:hypothetical protein
VKCDFTCWRLRRAGDNGLMKSILCILLTTILAMTSLARAEKAMGGIGVVTCDVWLEARKAPQSDKEALTEVLVLAWVQGYLSSKNSNGFEDNMVLDVPDHTVINKVLDKTCAQLPGSKIYSIADDFAKTLIEMYGTTKRK